MSGAHPDLGPELRQLAQTILDRLDPAVRSAAAMAAGGGGSSAQGKCQQVWCPVCALAALASGEQHPLLTVIAEHSVALLAAVRAVIDSSASSAATTDAAGPTDTPPGPDEPPPDGSPPPGGGRPPPPSDPGRYQHIPVTVEE